MVWLLGGKLLLLIYFCEPRTYAVLIFVSSKIQPLNIESVISLMFDVAIKTKHNQYIQTPYPS